MHRVYPGEFTFKKFLKSLRSKGFKYLFFLRMARYSKNKVIVWFSRLMLYFLGYRYGFQIPRQTHIGPGLFIGHFGTLVVSTHAKIGSNCNLAHNVTIGAARGRRAGAPALGDSVWVGTGAVLVGNITIGSDVMIAPNAFVNFDVPDHSLVIGNPAQIIARENATHDYINNKAKL